MRIRRTIPIPLLGVILLTGFLSAQPHSVNKPDDTSAIYANLMRSPVFTALGKRQDQCWAVVDTTINIDDMSPPLAPDAALQPPSYDPKPFQEALADYNARKYQRLTLTHSPQSGSSYLLLSPQEAADFRASRGSANASDGAGKKYSGCAGITYFSDAYFSSHRNAALVYMLNWCASLCSHGEWIYLEKRDDRWVQRSGQAAITSGAKPF